MDELEQERQRQLRLKALAQGGDEALDRSRYGLAPEQEIAADPEIQRGLMAYAMPDGTPRPSPSPQPSPAESGLVQSIYDLLSGKQTAPAAPAGNSGLYKFKPGPADALSEQFGGKKRKK